MVDAHHFSNTIYRKIGRSLVLALVLLLWLASPQAAEICNNILTKTLTQPINETTSCTVTGTITLGPGLTVASGATLILYAPDGVSFIGPVTIAGDAGLEESA